MTIKTLAALTALTLQARSALGQQLQSNGDSKVFIVFSGLERLSIIAVGGIAIWLGYKLFSLVLESNSIIEAQASGGYKLKISKIGPGVFFCLFGSLLLGFSMFRAPTFSIQSNREQPNVKLESKTGGTQVEQISGAFAIPTLHQADGFAYIRSISAMQSLCLPERMPHFSSKDTSDLSQAKSNLGALKKTLVDSITSPGSYEWWERIASDAQINGVIDPKLSDSDKKRYKELNSLIIGE